MVHSGIFNVSRITSEHIKQADLLEKSIHLQEEDLQEWFIIWAKINDWICV